MQPHLIRPFAIFGCALAFCGFAAPLFAQTAPVNTSRIELEQLDQFVRSFAQSDLPSIELPPQLLDSSLREQIMPLMPQRAPNDLPSDFASQTIAVLTENLLSETALENYTSDLFPQALDQQLILLAAQTPGVAVTNRHAAELISPLQNPETIQRVRFLIRAIVYCLEKSPAQTRQFLDALYAYMNCLETDNLLWQNNTAVVCLDMLERRLVFWEQVLAVRLQETDAPTALAKSASSMKLLRTIEAFEATPTPANEKSLRTAIAEVMKSSTAEVANFGKIVQSLYRSPNLKLYLSTVLLNHLLPTPEREYMRFRDVVAGRDVAGRRRVDTQIALVTIPDNEAIKFAIQVRGRVAALGTTSAMSTTLHSISSAEYFGQKAIEWTDAGFRSTPAAVSVNNTRTALRAVQPGVALPFLGSMVSGAIRNQYEMRQDEITAETRGKIVQQARTKINGEVDTQFLKINKWYRENVERPAHDLGMTLTLSEARTDTHWLLPAWRIGREGSLALYAPAPETPFGAFADVKIHESAFNILFDSLEVGGQTLSIGELRKRLGKKLRQNDLLLAGDHDEMMICLAEDRPLRIRFYQDCVEIALAVQMLKLNQQTMRDFQIFVTYTPQAMPDGTLHLVRDGIVRLGGDILPRHQVPLRTIFGKVFAPQRTFPMAPEFLATDPRFDGLQVGESRIDGGWLALALVLTNEPDGEAISSAAKNSSNAAENSRLLRRIR